MKIGTNDISKIYLGGSEISKIMLGTSQVYSGDTPTPPAPSYDTQYLTFVAKESGTFKFSGNSIDYSIDSGNTWTTLASDTDSPTVASGGTIMWKASGLTPSSSNGIGRFSSTGEFDIQGNVMSLVYGDNFSGQTTIQNNQFVYLFSGAIHITSAENLILPATALAYYCYYGMFYGCTNLTTAPELPATTLAERCYNGMFNSCTSLTTAPVLPATTLAFNCYYEMFRGCTSLTTAPVLPATTLTSDCYYGMFYGCTNLTTAPELPATTLAEGCYRLMFSGCTSLNYIKCLATDISAINCTYRWVRKVASTGTFVKAASMTSWTTDANGIPSGWTVENDDGSPVDNGRVD